MKRRTLLPVAASLTATAALLLTACGGGGDDAGGGGKIAGAATADATPSASPSASTAASVIDRPKMTLPSDVKLVFDLAKPSDAKEAAALGDAENFVRAIAYGIVKQDAGDAAYKFYSVPLSNAQSYAKDQIQQHIDNGYTITGTRRLTHGKVVMASNGTQASVSFCEDDSKFYGREVKTRKIHVTAPSANDYYYFEIVMTASTGHKGLWTAEAIEVQGKATQCKA